MTLILTALSLTGADPCIFKRERRRLIVKCSVKMSYFAQNRGGGGGHKPEAHTHTKKNTKKNF